MSRTFYDGLWGMGEAKVVDFPWINDGYRQVFTLMLPCDPGYLMAVLATSKPTGRLLVYEKGHFVQENRENDVFQWQMTVMERVMNDYMEESA